MVLGLKSGALTVDSLDVEGCGWVIREAEVDEQAGSQAEQIGAEMYGAVVWDAGCDAVVELAVKVPVSGRDRTTRETGLVIPERWKILGQAVGGPPVPVPECLLVSRR